MAMQVKDTNRARRSLWVAALVTLVVHIAVVPNVGVGAGRANVMLAFAAYAALGTGGELGVVVGFLAGVAFDLTTTGPVGLMALELTLASFVLGREARNRLADDTLGAARAFLLCAVAVELGYALAMLATGQASGLVAAILSRSLPSLVLDCVAFAAYLAAGSRGSRGGAAFSGGAGSSALGGKRLRGR